MRPPRAVFISRLSPDTTVESLLKYISDKMELTPGLSREGISCFKISRPDSLVASFKLLMSPDVFDLICSAAFWPEGVIVHEYLPRKRKSGSTMPAALKNMENLESTTKT